MWAVMMIFLGFRDCLGWAWGPGVGGGVFSHGFVAGPAGRREMIRRVRILTCHTELYDHAQVEAS